MRRQILIIASVIVSVTVVGIGGIYLAVQHALNSRNGPVHRFTLPAAESFLTDDRAAAIGREVMNRDGFPESSWKLMTDDRSKAPDGRPDRFLSRNAYNPNRGYLYFHCAESPTPQRFVGIELRDGEITAQGSLGK